jgi:hypothetical protein
VSVTLTGDEAAELAATLQCPIDELPDKFAPFASAAAEEYAKMLLNQANFSKASDWRDYRLSLLTRRVLSGVLPSPGLISRWFRTTATENRTILARITSKNPVVAESQIRSKLLQIVTSVEGAKDGYTVQVSERSIRAEIDAIIAQRDGDSPPLRLVRDTSTRYFLAPGSYKALCDEFEISEKERKHQK